MLKQGFIFLTIAGLLGCNSRQNPPVLQNLSFSTRHSIKYAHGFSITQVNKDIRLIKVFNPWEGAKGIEYKYILCPSGTQVHDSLKNILKVQTPVKRVICLSTTHIALLSFIG